MKIDLYLMDYKDRIKTARRARGLKRHVLAKQCDISYAYLVKLEEGTMNNPSMKVLKKIAEVLDVSSGELLGDK